MSKLVRILPGPATQARAQLPVGSVGTRVAAPEALSARLRALEASLSSFGSALVAFSGGVDSTFLLAVGRRVLGDRCVALTAVSPTMARREIEDARALAVELGARHLVVESHELDRANFRDNPGDRCYHCKVELLELAFPEAARHGLEVVLLGTNTDDLSDRRPGLQAALERGARSPMVEAGLSKADVRELSRQLGLRTWDKPQLACLSSRFPQGTRIDEARLARVDAFEEGLRAFGFSQLRVRFHEPIARIELPVADLPRALEPTVRERLVALGQSLGFRFVTIDLAGFRSGSTAG